MEREARGEGGVGPRTLLVVVVVGDLVRVLPFSQVFPVFLPFCVVEMVVGADCSRPAVAGFSVGFPPNGELR